MPVVEDVWGKLFALAQEQAEQGLALVEADDWSARVERKRKRSDVDDEQEKTDAMAEDKEGGKGNRGDTGCFRQPPGLAQLYQRLSKGVAAADDATVELQRQQEEKEEKDILKEKMGKQVCRQWLKHHFLGSGEACDSSCGRAHATPTNPNLLYKDYSFKGLSKDMRTRIMAKLVGEKS